MGGLNTGDKGGQCVKYAGEIYFGKLFGVMEAKEVWSSSKVERCTNGPISNCVAVWDKSDKSSAGHVGVVESVKSSGIRYSDSNRNPPWEELVEVKDPITQNDLEDLMPNFLGYVTFK